MGEGHRQDETDHILLVVSYADGVDDLVEGEVGEPTLIEDGADAVWSDKALRPALLLSTPF